MDTMETPSFPFWTSKSRVVPTASSRTIETVMTPFWSGSLAVMTRMPTPSFPSLPLGITMGSVDVPSV